MNASSLSTSCTIALTFLRPSGPGVLSRMRRQSAANCSRVVAMAFPPSLMLPEPIAPHGHTPCTPSIVPTGNSVDGGSMNKDQLAELLYQALETEQGGIKVYETALRCVINEELDLDPAIETPGRLVVRHVGQSLVTAMEMALDAGVPDAAQLVATECVVSAETKDHLNWELIGQAAAALKGDQGR